MFRGETWNAESCLDISRELNRDEDSGGFLSVDSYGNVFEDNMTIGGPNQLAFMFVRNGLVLRIGYNITYALGSLVEKAR